MSTKIDANVKIGQAVRSKIKGAMIDANGPVLSDINAGVEVEKADSSEVSGAEVRLGQSGINDIELLKNDFQLLLARLEQDEEILSTDVATYAVKEELKKNPDLKKRLFNAFKAGSNEALKAIFDNPVVSISLETIKAFLEKSA